MDSWARRGMVFPISSFFLRQLRQYFPARVTYLHCDLSKPIGKYHRGANMAKKKTSKKKLPKNTAVKNKSTKKVALTSSEKDYVRVHGGRSESEEKNSFETMTVLIHGTLDASSLWYQPGSAFHDFARQLYPNDYFEMDSECDFHWKPALPNRYSRWAGGEKLLHYCQAYHLSHGIQSFRFIGHSHGATVASICTNRLVSSNYTWRIKRLIMLAPLEWPFFPNDHLPNLSVVDNHEFFNLHSERDPIVQPKRQNFQKIPHLRDHEREFVLNDLIGHWLPTMDYYWTTSGFDQAV